MIQYNKTYHFENIVPIDDILCVLFTGDVCDGKQLREFHHRVMTGTGKTGVHLVMADGVGLTIHVYIVCWKVMNNYIINIIGAYHKFENIKTIRVDVCQTYVNSA